MLKQPTNENQARKVTQTPARAMADPIESKGIEQSRYGGGIVSDGRRLLV